MTSSTLFDIFQNKKQHISQLYIANKRQEFLIPKKWEFYEFLKSLDLINIDKQHIYSFFWKYARLSNKEYDTANIMKNIMHFLTEDICKKQKTKKSHAFFSIKN